MYPQALAANSPLIAPSSREPTALLNAPPIEEITIAAPVPTTHTRKMPAKVPINPPETAPPATCAQKPRAVKLSVVIAYVAPLIMAPEAAPIKAIIPIIASMVREHYIQYDQCILTDY